MCEKKKTLVFGAQKSGLAAASLLLSQGRSVVLYDGKKDLDRTAIEDFFKKDGVTPEIILGELPNDVLEELDQVVISPGVPLDLPVVEQMKQRKIPIIGELELAYQSSKGKVLAITGTNGKTTTTTLLGEIMESVSDSVYVVGNIGNPYAAISKKTNRDSVIVAEVSSFQLETIKKFRPRVSGILNITPDHLNRHHTMEQYIQVKESITKNQTAEDVCVLNYEDEELRRFGDTISKRVRTAYFSSQRALEEGLYLQEGIIYGKEKGKNPIKLLSTQEVHLLGIHNYENIMAAILMAYASGVPMESILPVVKSFQGVAHRIEYVGEYQGVAYYNDSKGTNPDAAIRGIRAMNRPTLLIGGGYDKGSSYEEWINAFDGKVKKFVLLGATREKIRESALKCGYPAEDIVLADSFEEAVCLCQKMANPGDAILLSPACASWGMFDNYEQRGDYFKKLVQQ